MSPSRFYTHGKLTRTRPSFYDPASLLQFSRVVRKLVLARSRWLETVKDTAPEGLNGMASNLSRAENETKL